MADWDKVTVQHVLEACNLYDSGANSPSRSSRTTFLILNGKSYPAKFIRGLAYKLATGIDLNPSRDYSGGVETAKFFQNLNFDIQHDFSAPSKDLSRKPSSNSLLVPGATVRSSRTYQDPQKDSIARRLYQRFPSMEVEAQFPWLVVPFFESMNELLRKIYDALVSMRNYSEFISQGFKLSCDFFVPSRRIIIEYDERQHFTAQRAKTLDLYPADLQLGFDKKEWTALCHQIQATDSSPPHRDEQRAFYDSLRDVLAAKNGFKLIRIRPGVIDWASNEGEHKLSSLFAESDTYQIQSASIPVTNPNLADKDDRIKKIAVVSHNCKVLDENGRNSYSEHNDYSEHFSRINRLCDNHGCDTILYALWTLKDDAARKRNHQVIYGDLKKVQQIIFEVETLQNEEFRFWRQHVEAWSSKRPTPFILHQRFAASQDNGKQLFLDELNGRRLCDSLIMICGETNVISLIRASDQINDPYGFCDRLNEMKIRVILNPIHDYMRRYEMREKRQHYSLGGRFVVSVWNHGKGKGEARIPWTVFYDGKEYTNNVNEIQPFSDRPDIRIGMVDLTAIDLLSRS